MRSLKDLDLDDKSRDAVKKLLNEWLQLFIDQANGEQGTSYRVDFEREDFFYFTNCQDILSVDPESKAVESCVLIQRRKKIVLLQLLIKSLLGEVEKNSKIHCYHCGYDYQRIDVIDNGHLVLCPKCKCVSVTTYIDSMGNFDRSIESVRKYFKEKEIV